MDKDVKTTLENLLIWALFPNFESHKMRVETTSRNIYKFSELSEKAKQKAIEDQSRFESGEWDSSYSVDDIKSTAKIFGLEIDNLYFSGFSSTVTGASFDGNYQYAKGGLKAIKADRPDDTELHGIVSRFQDLQRKSFYALSCSIVQHGNSYHENTIYIDSLYINEDYPNYDTTSIEKDLLSCLREFAQWAYALLNCDYDYRVSEEACIESIEANEYEFYENGEIV